MTKTPETDAFGGNLEDWINFAEKLEQDRNETREQNAKLARELDNAITQLNFAVGLLSTQPRFENMHPEEVLAFVKEGLE